MDTFIVQLIFIFFGFVVLAFVFSLFLKKKKENYVPESDVVNDSNYKIESIETEEQPIEDEGQSREYLRESRESNKDPLNEEDFHNYKEVIKKEK